MLRHMLLGVTVLLIAATASAQRPYPSGRSTIGPDRRPLVVASGYPSIYSPLDAGRDAYLRTERDRAAQIDRQIFLNTLAPWYRLDAYPTALWPSPFGPVAPRRVYVVTPIPRVEQPIGQERVWTGPNSYVSRPVYASELQRRTAPPPRPLPPTPRAEETIPTPQPAPERIPLPPPAAEPIPAPPPAPEVIPTPTSTR